MDNNNNLASVFEKYAAVVVFDTETTGLNAGECQIIELAAQRLTKAPDGSLVVSESMDALIKLPDGQRLPEKIVELTHITDEMLEAEGVKAETAAAQFVGMIQSRPVLLIAHNAQFDLDFTRALLWSCNREGLRTLEAADYLDSLTVYKDRAAYPHKLASAIEHYGLADKVQNSHRAIDDVAALAEVCKAMDAERDDLLNYVNLFGFNPKYGISGKSLEKVKYAPQQYANGLKAHSDTLPAIVWGCSFRG